jgi:hypothetical protein
VVAEARVVASWAQISATTTISANSILVRFSVG